MRRTSFVLLKGIGLLAGCGHTATGDSTSRSSAALTTLAAADMSWAIAIGNAGTSSCAVDAKRSSGKDQTRLGALFNQL